jgi:hypothetical protein
MLPYQFSPAANNMIQRGIFFWGGWTATPVNPPSPMYSLQVAFKGYTDSVKAIYSVLIHNPLIFNHCYTLQFIDTQSQSNMYNNSSHIDYFSRGVGLIRSSGLPPRSWTRILVSATINGRIVYTLPDNAVRTPSAVAQKMGIRSGIYALNGRRLGGVDKVQKERINTHIGKYFNAKTGEQILR